MDKLEALEKENKSLNKEIDTLNKVVAEYEKKNELEYSVGNPLMVWKLGDYSRGWVPGKEHFAKAVKFIKDSRLDKRFNILVYHYGINVEVFNK